MTEFTQAHERYEKFDFFKQKTVLFGAFHAGKMENCYAFLCFWDFSTLDRHLTVIEQRKKNSNLRMIHEEV